MPKVIVRGSREPVEWEEGAYIDAFRARLTDRRKKAKKPPAE